MGDIGTTITSGSIPAVGTAGTTYASNLNLFLTEVKARLESKVPRTSLADGDLDLNGYDITNALTVGFSPQASTPTTPNNSIQVYNNELWWVGSGGVVQITNGAVLNAAALGGITGDYGGANPAQFRFVDTDQEFYAYDDFAGGAWARVWARNFDLAANNTGNTRVRFEFDGGSSYTLTVPDAAPASTSVVTMDSTGKLLNSARTVVMSVSPATWMTDTSAVAIQDKFIKTNTSWGGPNAVTPTTVTLFIPVSAPVGATITGYKLWYRKTTDAAHVFDVTLYKSTATGTVTTPVTDSINSNNPGYTSLDKTGLAISTAAGEMYNVRINYTAATNPSGDEFIAFDLTYTTVV